ncbi:uncharacterized protein LOC130630609 [Hydractinia symbiolongicarpus]|uniref:uncharacterized protein LOC130630609 n=1 Tax=Hydractinia symbiolongicarpus TaxID=13093 RepID=UPI00254ED417|nr:uncharacterized protein LOC130630609 [Hydractinia symbiolongicarpus]
MLKSKMAQQQTAEQHAAMEDENAAQMLSYAWQLQQLGRFNISMANDEASQAPTVPLSFQRRHISNPNTSSSSSNNNNNNNVLLLSSPESTATFTTPSLAPQIQTEVDKGDEEVDSNFLEVSLASRIVDIMPSYPCLWKTNQRSYKDINKKDQAWTEISLKLGASVEKIKYDWSKIRENYRKCLKKRDARTKSGAGYDKLPTCNFFNELRFLSDSLSNKVTDSNILNSDSGSVIDVASSETSEVSDDVIISNKCKKKKGVMMMLKLV